MSLNIIFAALITLACLPGAVQAAKLYKWVDEEGQTHYSDKIPPSEVKRARSELDEQGLTIDSVNEAKSTEELRREAEEARLRKEQERLAEMQRQEDRVLLRTFRSVDDIKMTRDGQIQAVDTYIRVTEANIKRLKNTLAEMQKNAADLELSGKRVSARYLKDIESKRQALKDSYESIVERENEKKRIRQSFANDLKRFQELKQLAQTNDPTQEATQSNAEALQNVYNCGEDKACEQPWQRAIAYAKRHGTTPVKMSGENIFMSGEPTDNEDISITVSRIHDRKSKQTLIFMDLQCMDATPSNELCGKSEQVQMIKAAFQEHLRGKKSVPAKPSSEIEVATPKD